MTVKKAFDAGAKAVLVKDVFTRYPNPDKHLHIYTDASNHQMGTVIMQEERPVAYFSCKLNSVQKNYTTMEKKFSPFHHFK
jgi:hypothetical protein